MVKTLLLVAAVIFVGSMSVSISISEQQITDPPNAPQGENHSNSVNEQPMIVMPLKKRSTADDINDS
jgi:hypothetical protein